MSAALLSAQSPLAAPSFAQRYHFIKQLGMGGSSRVWLAVDTHRSDQLVAVKQLCLTGLTMAERAMAKTLFVREARILAQLSHPCIPRLLDEWMETMPWSLVMDFVEGETLETYLEQQGGRLPAHAVVEIGLHLCAVLDYLHAQSPPVIFRDLKPANIMLTPTGRLVLIDFGIAGRYRPGQIETTAMGTAGYAAPELYPDVCGQAYPSPASDIYALGATLHFLLSGVDPRSQTRRFAFPSLHRRGAVQRNGQLIGLIEAMLAREPVQRPQSASEVAAILQRLAL